MPIQSLDELLARPGSVAGQRVFVRADLNVPLQGNGAEISDDSRIRASLPTLERLIEAGARVVLASHLGRPKGERKPELSLSVVAKALAERLSTTVAFADDCVGEAAMSAAAGLANGELLLLENLRFHKAETDNEEGFARDLAALADVYGERFGARRGPVIACAVRAIAWLPSRPASG